MSRWLLNPPTHEAKNEHDKTNFVILLLRLQSLFPSFSIKRTEMITNAAKLNQWTFPAIFVLFYAKVFFKVR